MVTTNSVQPVQNSHTNTSTDTMKYEVNECWMNVNGSNKGNKGLQENKYSKHTYMSMHIKYTVYAIRHLWDFEWTVAFLFFASKVGYYISATFHSSFWMCARVCAHAFVCARARDYAYLNVFTFCFLNRINNNGSLYAIKRFKVCASITMPRWIEWCV